MTIHTEPSAHEMLEGDDDLAAALAIDEDDASAGGRQVGVSALWSAANTVILRVATFAVSLLVARLVAPFEFGVYTVALTVYTVVLTLVDLGVGSAIVREHDRSRQIAPTIFTISLVFGALVAGGMVLLAPLLARELGAVQAASAIRVLAIFVLLSGFSVVPASLMSRDFMQRERFITDVAYFVVSTATMLILVLRGHPVMGLVWGQVGGQLVTVILIMAMSPEKYWPGFNWTEAKGLLAFGVPLAGANMVSKIVANVDFIVIGHQLGALKLGYYNLAFNIAGWPVSIFSAVLISVTLPTLSRARSSPSNLFLHLRAGLSAVVAASFPVCALLCALALPLVNTVYGHRWAPAYTALVVLAIFGAARTVLTLFSDLVIALGLTNRLLVIQLTWLAFLTPAMIFGVREWGIVGAGVAHAVVVTFIIIPMYLLTVRKNSSVSLRFMRPVMLRPFLASLVAAGVAYGVTRLIGPEALKLVAGAAAGTVAYVLCARRWLLTTGRTLHAMYWQRA